MKKIFLLLIITASLFVEYLYSQTKTLTIEEAVIGLSRELYPEYIQGLKFRPESNEISFIKDNALYTKEFGRVKTKFEEKEIFNIDNLNDIPLISVDVKHIIKRFTSFPAYEWISKNVIGFSQGKSYFVLDIVNKEYLQAQSHFIFDDDEYNNLTFSPNKQHYAYTIENNLFVNTGTENQQVSNEKDNNIVYGQTVSRNEFGIDGGIFWSPKSNLLAFYRKDESGVTNYPIVNTQTRIATLESTKYPMAGMTSELITIGIYNLENQQIIYLKTDEYIEQYLTSVTWSPDEKYIYLAKLNRKQKHLQLQCYDVQTGNLVKTLFEEKNEKYVEPQNQLTFLPNDPSKFIWQSRKDGYNHLYLYDTNGREIRQLTKGNYEVQQIYGFSQKGDAVFVKANKETPINFDIYKVTLANATIKRISSNEGSHNATFSNNFKYFIDQYSNTTTPNVYNLCNSDGIILENLLTSKNPLENYEMPDMKIGTIKANDGKTDLYYRLITPKNLDKTKKYPCIVYVYGGPHAQMITNRWLGGAAGWDHYMAQKGYIVFTLDNRGSANRGFEFESIIHRQLGTVECQDQISGIEFLKTLEYVDMDRIGVHGWSYGGFLTTTLMCDYADIFKVGVAGGPVINWELYEVMYGERYMDSPEINADGYKNNNLINKVEKLKGRLMLIHGAIDPVVVWQHSQNFIEECIKKNILVDYFVYPAHEHNVRGYDRIHLMRTVTRYFDENLK